MKKSISRVPAEILKENDYVFLDSFMRENMMNNERISTRPSIIRNIIKHFNSRARDGVTIPALNPVQVIAEVVSNKASTGSKPYIPMTNALPIIKAIIKITNSIA